MGTPVHSSKAAGADGPRVARVRTVWWRRAWWFWAYPLLGLAGLVWFLVRVPLKPSRAAYPCQRVAAPLGAGFVLSLGGLAGGALAFRKARAMARRSRWVLAAICAALSVVGAFFALSTAPADFAVASPPDPNAPIGVAHGLHPGRVVWVHEPDATNWAGVGDGHWWEPAHTDGAVVERMLTQALRRLSGAESDAAAWDALIRHHNLQRGKGDVGYQAGEKVMIKVNLVGCIDAQPWGGVNPSTYELVNRVDYMNTSPQVMLALLRQLVEEVGVSEADITIGDPICLFPNQYYQPLHDAFPAVHFLDKRGLFGRTHAVKSTVPIYWSCRPQNVLQDYLMTAYTEAEYFIDVANLKSHATAGVTLCAKNHYGSLRNPDAPGYYDLHATLPDAEHAPGGGHYRALVDLLGHAQTGGKAILYLVDGLYAGVHPDDTAPIRWAVAPFNGDWTSSIFAAQDPVAIDSVGFDFLWDEGDSRMYPRMAGADDYLHEAALANDPPSGTFYDPNHATAVQRLASLGVHEHWNNATDRQYSRNLATGEGIELVQVSGPCVDDADCADGVWCNGAETCARSGECVPGAPPCPAGAWCDETAADCVDYGSGDTEPDGDVDLADYAAFQRCFGDVGVGPCQPCNLCGEGDVAVDDSAAFVARLNGPQ